VGAWAQLTNNSFPSIRIRDIAFADTAINYEEGKWVVEHGHKLFKPSYRTIESRTVSSMANFTQGAYEPTYKYGSFISGSAVREDARDLFDLLNRRVSVRYIQAPCRLI
jgi:hypothetical protein